METHDQQTMEGDAVTEDAAPEATPLPPNPPAAAPVYGRPPQEKTPLVAAILSFVPGLGNIYNGLYARGISFAIAFVVLVRIASTVKRDQEIAMIVPTMIFFCLFNIFDAYRQANLINMGYWSEESHLAPRKHAELGGGFLVPGILLTVLGAFSVLDRYLDVYVWDILDHWPIPALLLGIYLIWRSVQAGRPRTADEG